MYEWYHQGCPGNVHFSNWMALALASWGNLSTHSNPNPPHHPHAFRHREHPEQKQSGEGHTRDPAATRALCPHVRNLEVRALPKFDFISALSPPTHPLTHHQYMKEWLSSDGVPLIDRMAYQEGWASRLHDGLMWAVAHAYGAYLRWIKRE
jgi:hypothetical protein